MDLDPNKKLDGVHPDLVKVISRAFELAPVKFIITEGLRDKEKQAKLVKAGASKTLNSRHLTGKAVDVVAKIDGEIRWDWPLYTTIAKSVQKAAIELGIPIVWGGGWFQLNTTVDLSKGVKDYIDYCRRTGKKPLMDGPHFELDKIKYP